MTSQKETTKHSTMTMAQLMDRFVYLTDEFEQFERENPRMVDLHIEMKAVLEEMKDRYKVTHDEPYKSKDGKIYLTYTEDSQTLDVKKSPDFIDHLWKKNKDALKISVDVKKLTAEEKVMYDKCTHTTARAGSVRFYNKRKTLFGV